MNKKPTKDDDCESEPYFPPQEQEEIPIGVDLPETLDSICVLEEPPKEEPDKSSPEIALIGMGYFEGQKIDLSNICYDGVIPFGRDSPEAHLTAYSNKHGVANLVLNIGSVREDQRPHMFQVEPSESRVSRVHGLFLSQGSGIVRAVDLGSLGGTYVESKTGERVCLGKAYPSGDEWHDIEEANPSMQLPSSFKRTRDFYDQGRLSNDERRLTERIARECHEGFSNPLQHGDVISLAERYNDNQFSIRYVNTLEDN